jgi:hypothetical protein
MFIDVYSKATGRKHRVPEHYMDHPVLSKPFRKTPKTRDTETTSATPETDVVTATPTTETPAAGDKE